MKNTITTIILSLFTIGMLYSQSCDRELSSLEPNDPNNSNWVVPADGVTCVSSDITINRLEIADGGTILIAEDATLTIAQGVFPAQIPNRNSTIEVHGNLKFNQATVIPISTDLTVHENGSLSVGNNGDANLNFKGDDVNFLNKGFVEFSVLDISENSNSYIDNEGTMEVKQNINIDGKAEFINTGNLSINASFNNNADSRYINCGEVQTGGFNLQGGEVINTGIFISTGTIEMNEASSSIKNYNTFTANSINLAGATIYNAGYFTLPTITSTGDLEGPDSGSNYWGSFTFSGPQNGFNTGNISGQLKIIDQNDPSSNANLFNPSNTVDSSVVFGTCTSCTVNTDIEECPSSDNPLVGSSSAVDDNTTTDQNTPVSIDVAANDDIDMEESTVSITDQPSNGTVEVNSTTGIVTYWPNEDYVGTDTFTYRICTDNTETDCETATVTIDVLELPCSVPINGNYFEWDYENSNDDTVTETIQQPSANAGFVIDIWRLDNSFNMNINGVDLATNEIEFQSSDTPGPINIKFQDGDEYETNTNPDAIWKMQGSEEKPLIRVKIGPNGEVKMFGSKVNEGPLYPLELFGGNSFNNITWNANSDNTVIFSQNVVGETNITGKGYGLNETDTPEITILTINNPTCENGEVLDNGSIEIETTGLVDGIYDFAYDGGTFEGVEVIANTATIPATGGIYNNIVIGSGNCQSPQGVSAMLIEPDCICLEAKEKENLKYYYSKSHVLSNNINFTYKESNFTFEGSNSGLIIDIYRLDNSFDLIVNGESIVLDNSGQGKNIEFQNRGNVLNRNIRFKDGDRYGTNGVPNIWQLNGVADNNPILRVMISADNEVSLFGVKENNGFLHELELFSDDNQSSAINDNVSWNKTSNNTVTLRQQYVEWTSITADLYTIQDHCGLESYYTLNKTGEFNDVNNDGFAQLGETITYTFEVINEGNTDIYNPLLMDEMLGGTITVTPVENGNQDGILNFGETWTYTVEYPITSDDIETGGVYNQAHFFGQTEEGYFYPSQLSEDPTDTTNEYEGKTFTSLNMPDDYCQTMIPMTSEYEFYWDRAMGYGGPDFEREGVAGGANGGFIFDIYKLRGTFNMSVNQMNISPVKMSFYDRGSFSPINVEFTDGAQYNQNGIPNAYQIEGDRASNQPIVRIRVFPDGNVKVYGAKESFGELYELQLKDGSEFNTVTWNDATDNDIKISQKRLWRTIMDGAGYSIQNDCQENSYTLTKSGEFVDGDGDGTAQVGETIRYTFVVKNNANMAIKDIGIYDAKLGGFVETFIGGDQNSDGALNPNEEWTYEGVYELTEEDIARGGVFNQAELTGKDGLNTPLIPVTSTYGDPQNASPDDDRPNHTYVELPIAPEDCVGLIQDHYLEYYTSGFRTEHTSEFSVDAGNDGYVIDIYELDNSFNLSINQTQVFNREVQFWNSGFTTPNVEFPDGTTYQSGVPNIKNLQGDAENPIVRITISKDGEVSLEAAKQSLGELHPLTMINNDPNQVTWYNNDENTIVFSQEEWWGTTVEAQGYIVQDKCANDYVAMSVEEEGNLDQETVNYYPNPVNSTLYLQANSPIENVEIYNLLGQKVINLQPNSNETNIDMSHLQTDVYMMRVTTNGKTESFRIMKK